MDYNRTQGESTFERFKAVLFVLFLLYGKVSKCRKMALIANDGDNMSRKTITVKGIAKEILDDPQKCRFLIDEVCCNADEKDMVADFPAKEYCRKCRNFEKEESVI